MASEDRAKMNFQPGVGEHRGSGELQAVQRGGRIERGTVVLHWP